MYKLKEIKIINFKSIDYAVVKFAKNKTVFVWKNNAWKSNVLKALALFFSWDHKFIKPNYFNDKTRDIILEVVVTKNNFDLFILKIVASLINGVVEVKYEDNYDNKERQDIKNFLEKVDFIYIPSDRWTLNKNNSWYTNMVNLILKNKMESVESKEVTENLENIIASVKKIVPEEKNILFNEGLNYLSKSYFDVNNWDNEILDNVSRSINENEQNKDIANFDDLNIWTRNFILIALFDLYFKSLKFIENDRFRVFIIDHVENFLHPHSVRLIDKLLQDISESENTQIIYSTHANELVSNFKKDKYEIDSIRFVYKLNGYTKIKQIENKYGNYDKIMINLIFKNTDIFFSDAVILVEWETEKISIPNIFEYRPWKEEDLLDCNLNLCKKTIWQNKVNDFFNLYLKNIAVIDVWWKWALCDWYEFCSELLWKRNVFAIIDKDANFYDDKRNIERSIKKVHWRYVREHEYIDYNWIVLDWEFENYYKWESIKEYLLTVLSERYKDDHVKKSEIKQLIYKIDNLKIHKKISVSYEKLFKTYLRGYGKPTIAFNLCIWLCEHNWYKRGLMDILKKILYKIEKNRNLW